MDDPQDGVSPPLMTALGVLPPSRLLQTLHLDSMRFSSHAFTHLCRLTSQYVPPVRIKNVLKPSEVHQAFMHASLRTLIHMSQTGDNQFVYNIGVYIAGVCKFFFNGSAVIVDHQP
jgi:hypothetical protein